MSVSTPYGVTVIVEAALSAATGTYGAWDTALWDVRTWGPDLIWTDISSYVRSVNTDRHFSRDVQTWEPGTATIVLDNRDARFSPSNLTGPYAVGGVTGIRPWRPIRIRVIWAGVTYNLYRGYGVDWQETYVDPFPDGGDAIMTVQCLDEFGSLARFGGLAEPPIGAGDTAGARVNRILDNAGHTGTRNIDQGVSTMQATDLSPDAISELKVVVDSEGGSAFVARDGTITFERETALIENARSNTIQATWGDGSGSELPYAGVVPSYDGSLIANIAAWSRVGGLVQTSVDATSRALYGDKRNSRTDLMSANDIQVAGVAAYFVMRYAQPEDRIAQVRVKPRYKPTLLFPAVLVREVRDLVRAIRRPPGGITVTRDCHISGIAHAISGDDWVTTFSLWSAAIYQGVGRWNLGTWDTSTWFF